MTKVLFSYNYGNIVFKSDELNFLENKKYLMFIYSLNLIQNNEIEYSPKVILSFSHYQDMNKHYEYIILKDIFEECKYYPYSFESLYQCKFSLIENKDS